MAKNSLKLLLLAAAFAPTALAQTNLAAPYDGYSYLACRSDDSSSPSSRTFGNKPPVTGQVTVEKCIDVCSGAYKYVGLENGNECWCGNDINAVSTVAAPASCDTPCEGNGAEFCGGLNRLSVYENPNFVTVHTQPGNPNGQQYTIPEDVGNGYHFVGCIADTDDKRAVPADLHAAYGSVTLETCAAQCAAEGIPGRYIGITFGRECYCSNTLNTAGGASQGCTFQCEAQPGSTEACGGLHATQVYSTNPDDFAVQDSGSGGTTTTSLNAAQASSSSSAAAAAASKSSVTSSRSAASASVSSSRSAAVASLASVASVKSSIGSAYSASRESVRASVTSRKSLASEEAAASRVSVTSSRSAASVSLASVKSAILKSKSDLKDSAATSKNSAAASRISANSVLSSSRSVANAALSSSRAAVAASKTTSLQIAAISRASVLSAKSLTSVSVASSKAAASASRSSDKYTSSSSRSAANASLSSSRSAANASQSSSRSAAEYAKTATTMVTSTTTTSAAGGNKLRRGS